MPGTRGTERTEELRLPQTALRREAAELDLPTLEAWAAQGDLDSLRELWRLYAQGAGGAAEAGPQADEEEREGHSDDVA